MSEAELEQAVRGLIAAHRLLGYHTHDSRRSTPGFPDWVVVGPGGCVFRELKSESGQLSGMQSRWLYALTGAGVDASVWRPRDLVSGRIGRELEALTCHRGGTRGDSLGGTAAAFR